MLARYINKSDEPEAARTVGKRDGIARGRRTNKYSSTTRKRTDYRPGSGLLSVSLVANTLEYKANKANGAKVSRSNMYQLLQ